MDISNLEGAIAVSKLIDSGEMRSADAGEQLFRLIDRLASDVHGRSMLLAPGDGIGIGRMAGLIQEDVVLLIGETGNEGRRLFDRRHQPIVIEVLLKR